MQQTQTVCNWQSLTVQASNVLGPPENQDGGHIILSGCHGGWSRATDVGVVRQLSNQ